MMNLFINIYYLNLIIIKFNINMNEIESMNETRGGKYINKYFYKFDGKRCLSYAREIDSFINNFSSQNDLQSSHGINIKLMYNKIIKTIRK